MCEGRRKRPADFAVVLMTSLIVWFLIMPTGKRPVRRYGLAALGRGAL
jgi:hypothetical protein